MDGRTVRGAKDVALDIGEGEDLLAAGVPAEVDLWEVPENTGNKTQITKGNAYLVFFAEAHGAEVQLRHDECERVFGRELGVGEGLKDARGGVDALAELCAVGRCAAESDASDGERLCGSVVDAAGVPDGVALLELHVHVVERLVLEAGDFSDFEVAGAGDVKYEEREVAGDAVCGDGEGVLEEVAALLAVLRAEERALGGEEDGVDDGACGHCGVVLGRGEGVEGVEAGDGGEGRESRVFCGLWRVPVEVEGEAFVGGVVGVGSAEAVVGGVVVRSAAVLLLRCEDGAHGACIHAGAGARHCALAKGLLGFVDQVLKRGKKEGKKRREK